MFFLLGKETKLQKSKPGPGLNMHQNTVGCGMVEVVAGLFMDPKAEGSNLGTYQCFIGMLDFNL
jgi:hypothetical protein